MTTAEITGLINWLTRRRRTLSKTAAAGADKLMPELRQLLNESLTNPTDRRPTPGTLLAKLWELYERSPRKHS